MKNILLQEISVDELSERVTVKILEGIKPLFPTRETQEYITRREAANILRISLPTLHSWTVTGRLKSYRIGTRIRYKKSEVLASMMQVRHAIAR
jgi:excisionase family DNA binding protein